MALPLVRTNCCVSPSLNSAHFHSATNSISSFLPSFLPSFLHSFFPSFLLPASLPSFSSSVLRFKLRACTLHLSHASNPFCFSFFSYRVLFFCPGLTSDGYPLTHSLLCSWDDGGTPPLHGLIFFSFELGSHYVVQAGLELLD
jgi:hypothetical protein